MSPEEVKQCLVAALPECESIAVEGDGSHFDIAIVGSLFTGLREVQRQQKVYAALSSEIASGAIHAVNIKTATPEECQ